MVVVDVVGDDGCRDVGAPRMVGRRLRERYSSIVRIQK